MRHSALIWGAFCCVLHYFRVILQRSALIWVPFAAFCINLGSFCCILYRFGGRFAAFCINLASFCAVIQRFGIFLRRSANIWGRCGTQQNDTKFMQNAAKRPQIRAERSKTAPNQCGTQQNDPKSMRNVAKRPQIHAERSRTTPNSCRTQQNDPKYLCVSPPTPIATWRVLYRLGAFWPLLATFSPVGVGRYDMGLLLEALEARLLRRELLRAAERSKRTPKSLQN